MPAKTGLLRIPPMREAPDQADAYDGQRLDWATQFWNSQNLALLRRDRQIEENIRMLAGRHWSVWNSYHQRWLDVTEWMTDEERRWRQLPVVNRLLYWFMLTHARLTENSPIITFQPATGDRHDAELAEVQDVIFKTKWSEAGLLDALDQMVSWLIPGGHAGLISGVDTSLGELKKWEGDAQIPVRRGDGSMAMESDQPQFADAQGVPFDQNGEPLAFMDEQGQMQTTGDAHQEREGDLRVDVLSPLQYRGSWGIDSWHKKWWHVNRSFLTPEEIWQLYGKDVAPDAPMRQGDIGATRIQRLLFGSGYYGAADGRLGSSYAYAETLDQEGYVQVDSLWVKPMELDNVPGMAKTDENPGGRLLVHTGKEILSDGPRPFAFPYTSPIRHFVFVNLPGRPGGTSPQEMLNSIQRSYNKGYAHSLEHRNLETHPIKVVDRAAGIGDDVQITNAPGQTIRAIPRPRIPPIQYIVPPSLSPDHYKLQEDLRNEMDTLGNITGAEGAPPSTDPSGELVKELRFNADRFLGPTSRRMVEELARIAEDWNAIFAGLWTTEKILHYAGEDQVVRTIMVSPDLFRSGRTNVVPDLESMLPEGRGARQQRIAWMYDKGLFGPPGTPGSTRKYLEMANFPHVGRTTTPGGIDFVMANQENGKLVQGEMAVNIPVYPWYNHEVHVSIHRDFMAGPDFLRLDPEVQSQFIIHLYGHEMALAEKIDQQQREQLTNAAATQGAAKRAGLLDEEPNQREGVRPAEASQPKSQETASAP